MTRWNVEIYTDEEFESDSEIDAIRQAKEAVLNAVIHFDYTAHEIDA